MFFNKGTKIKIGDQEVDAGELADELFEHPKFKEITERVDAGKKEMDATIDALGDAVNDIKDQVTSSIESAANELSKKIEKEAKKAGIMEAQLGTTADLSMVATNILLSIARQPNGHYDFSEANMSRAVNVAKELVEQCIK